MMKYELNALTSHGTGAEIRGLDLRKPLDHGMRGELNEAFAKFHVLVFREQDLPSRDFARAAENFGDIMPQQSVHESASGTAGVVDLKPIEVTPGKFVITGERWHTDHSWEPRPPKATALHARLLPRKGGDTQFVNMHNAYDDLPPDLKRRVEGLTAVHTYRDLTGVNQSNHAESSLCAAHPLVQVHPENGRRFLYLNKRRMTSIHEMADAEALALIDELVTHATQLKYEYRHVWQDGDMVIWDNRSVLHQANGDYDMRQGRHMYRLMLEQ